MKVRIDKGANYKAIFFNGKTIRQRIDPNMPITVPTYAEIEDVAINNKCFAGCSYCYTSALKTGVNFNNIVEKAQDIWGARTENDRPFQIAIGGAGESTLHPQWADFVKAVRSLNIMPNYTTNGMHITEDLLKATEQYCGGVAVSYHPHIKRVFGEAISKYSKIKTRLNAHIIVGDAQSLTDAKEIYDLYRDVLEYFVILPYQAAGRAKEINTRATWMEMFKWVNDLPAEYKSKFAFGALFYEFLLDNEIPLEIDLYEPEIYSGYRIFDDSYRSLRVSSYNLKIKENEQR